MNLSAPTHFSSMSLPPLPSWKTSFSPQKEEYPDRQQDAMSNRSRLNTAQDSPVCVLDIYPTVQEIQDDMVEGLPPLPDITIRRPQKLQARSSSVGNRRTFREDYVLTRPMFRTAHCCIWECVHRRSGQRYCVKVMKDGDSEVETLMAVQYHPNICRHIENIKEADKTYMIMELYHGGNLLSHIVQNGVLDEESAVVLLRQILQGLIHLHETKQMVHGDISPDNILLHNDQHVVLADFGTMHTSSRYAAPERQSSFAADMYSVGAVLHCMLLGDTVELTETSHLSRLCKQFLVLLLHDDPDVRLTVHEALQHEFLSANAPETVRLVVEHPPPPQNFVRKLLRRRGRFGSSSAGSTASSCQS